MARRTGLGRGLDALIPGENEPQTSGVLFIAVEKISPNPRQPRNHMDEDELGELAASIQEHGVIQPLIVASDLDRPDAYTLIAGERRWLAARQAGLDRVPVIIREVTDQELLELALIENVQRTDLGPLETAEAYRQLSEDFHLSHEEIAARVAKSRSSVTNTLRLLKLPLDVQEALAKGQISEGHARAILALATPQAQSAALRTIITNGLNVRQTEELVKRLSGERPIGTTKVALPPEMLEIEERLRGRLGTRVRLTRHSKGGTIIIHYYSNEELDALVGQILGKEE